jgi:hypothetical protein
MRKIRMVRTTTNISTVHVSHTNNPKAIQRETLVTLFGNVVYKEFVHLLGTGFPSNWTFIMICALHHPLTFSRFVVNGN